jgi:uncharacterized membrane protein
VTQPVHPTRDDPIVAALSEGVGGPVGTHAGRHPWWTPARVILLLAALTMALGMVQKSGCYQKTWFFAPHQYTHMCYSDLPYLYTGRGLAELDWPYSNDPQVRQRYDVMEYPVGISYFAYGAAWVTHWASGSPDVEPRKKMPAGDLAGDHQVQKEVRGFVIVNGLVFAALALLSAWLLAGVNRRRPWDAAIFAASPTLALTALINWDMLSVVLVAAALFTWARGRPLATGVLIGLGTATKLYPLFLLGGILVICIRERRWRELWGVVLAGAATWLLFNAPAYETGPNQWHVFWSFNQQRGPDLGSIWLVISQSANATITAHTVNLWSWAIFGGWCVAVFVIGMAAPATPRLAQLGYLVVVGFLLINKVYSPQYVLWLLPLAALARPRWRDQLIWQATEVIYFASVWWYLAGDLAPGRGSDPGFYWIAIVVRMAGEIYLAGVITRDVLYPRHDPYRSHQTARQRERDATPSFPTSQLKPAGERSGGAGFG